MLEHLLEALFFITIRYASSPTGPTHTGTLSIIKTEDLPDVCWKRYTIRPALAKHQSNRGCAGHPRGSSSTNHLLASIVEYCPCGRPSTKRLHG